MNKKNEKGSSPREKLLETIIENLPNIVFLKEAKELRFKMFNQAAERVIGIPRSDLIGKNDDDFFPKEQAQFFQEKDRSVLKSKKTEFIPEEPIDTPNGKRWLRTWKVPLLDSSGQPEFLLGISEDITEEKKQSDLLQESEARLREAQNIAKIGSWEMDVESKSIRWSEQMFQFFSMNPEKGEPSFKQYQKWIHPDDVDYWKRVTEKCLEDGEPFTLTYRTILDDAQTLWVRSRGRGLKDENDRVTQIFGTSQDISEEKFRESILSSVNDIRRHYQQRPNDLKVLYGKLINEALALTGSEYGFIGEIHRSESGNADLRILFMNDISWDAAECEKNLSDLAAGVDRFALKNRFHFVIEHGLPLILDLSKTKSASLSAPPPWPRDSSEIQHFLGLPIYKGDEFIAILGVGSLRVRFNDLLIQQIQQFLSTVGDVLTLAKQNQIERISRCEIERQQIFLRNTVDRLPAVFYAKQIDGKFLLVNEYFRKLLNKSDEEIIGKDNHELFPKNVADQFRENDLKLISEKKSIESDEVAVDSSGRQRVYHSFKFPYISTSGEVYATGGVSVDVTEKKELEQQTYHTSKLAAIGEMAAGVGHEINNPLAIVKGHIARVARELEEGEISRDSVGESLKKVNIAIERIAGIVRGLRTFSRLDPDVIRVFDFLPAVEESIGMIQDIYQIDGIQVRLEKNLPEGSAFMYGNRGKMQQVLMNLISNARDATEGQAERTIEVSLSKDGADLLMKVSDNGEGVSPEVRDQIFNPFFTTKEVNRGTGMGLSLVDSIVREHSGRISVESNNQDGKTGAVFQVRVPMTDAPEESTTTESGALLSTYPQFQIRAMVVDDEEDVCEVLVEVLGDFGIQVTPFFDAQEAFEAYCQSPDDFDLIVSDMQMPVMNGADFIKKLRAEPNLKQPRFIFVTGGVSVSSSQEDALNHLADGYFFKPFEEEKIQELLLSLFPEKSKQ